MKKNWYKSGMRLSMPWQLEFNTKMGMQLQQTLLIDQSAANYYNR